MKKLLVTTIAVGSIVGCFDSLRADLTLVARYDWQDGAADVSGSPLVHNGTLDPLASVADGKLFVQSWAGVELGYMPELDGATEVLFRFEDVTLPEGGNYCVLAGGGYSGWWVGLYYRGTSDGTETVLTFNVGGWPSWDHPAYETQAIVASDIVTHFDSIEYRFDGSALPDERCAIRWNEGPWITGGWAEAEDFRTFTSRDFVRINDGARADWDPMNGTLGPVAFYSDQISAAGLQRPGDCNGDQALDIADAICLLGYLFLGSPTSLPCGNGTAEDPGNTLLLDSSGDSVVDLTDAVHVLGYLFLGTAPPDLGTDCVTIIGCPSNCEDD